MTKDELHKAIDEIEEAAYRRGFEAGKQALMSSVAQLAASVAPNADQKSGQVGPDDSALREMAASTPRATMNRPRAPRGRTGEVLRDILSQGYALTLSEIQRRAKAIDEALNDKTIHNELYRRPELYERNPSNGKWRWKGPAEVEGGQSAHQSMMEAIMS